MIKKSMGYKRMIGQNISMIRKDKGLTLSQLANQANVSKSYLSNIERDLNKNPSIKVIEKLASVLEIDVRVLLGAPNHSEQLPDREWLDFLNELQESGIGKDQIQEYKTVIEFLKWRNDKDLGKLDE